jgi:hypothetical protein
VLDDLREPVAQRCMEVPAVSMLHHVRIGVELPASSSAPAMPLPVIIDCSSARLTSAASSIGAVGSRKKVRYQRSVLTRCRSVSMIGPCVPGAGVSSCSGVRAAHSSSRRSVA